MTATATERFGSWEQAVCWLRDQPDRHELVCAAYYDDPLIDAARRYTSSSEWEAIARLVPESASRVLDVGAGRGIASYAFASMGARVDALEPDPSAIVGAEAIEALARQAQLPITVTREFSEALPYPDEAFDVVFARAVLHHTSDLRSACREFFRVLRPGGRLIAVREHVISRHSDLPAFLASHPLHSLYGRENALRLHEYTEAIRGAGFRLSSTLGPLASEMNYSPRTRAEAQADVARKLSVGIAALAPAVRALLAVPPMWWLVARSWSWIDSRPGRLYSFIADRPA
jgi:SAM-dependent methyltransferase